MLRWPAEQPGRVAAAVIVIGAGLLVAAAGPGQGGGAAGLLADDPGLVPAAGVVRGLWIAGGLLAGGVAMVRAGLVARGHRLPAVALQRAVALGVWAAVVGAVATPGLRAAVAAGTWAALTDLVAVERQLGGQVGRALLLTAAGLVAVAASMRRREPGWLFAGAVGGGLAAVAPLLTGHAATMDPRWLGGVAMGAHLLAAAVWLGGLVVLAAVLWAGRGDHGLVAERPRMAADVSGLALLAVAVVALAGATLAVVQVERLSALATPYGTVLLVKLGLLAAVLAVAWGNRRQVPRLRDGADGADGGGSGDRTGDRAAAVLGKGTRVELLGIAAVLVASAVLSSLEPAGQAAAEVVNEQAEVADREVLLVIDPAVAGRNELHLYVLDDGTPEGDSADAEVHAEGPDGRAHPAQPLTAGPGHWVDPAWELPVAGTWEVAVSFILDDEPVEADFTVSISD